MKHFFTKDQRGVGHLGLILAVVAVLALGGVGYFVYAKNKDSKVSPADKALQEAVKNAKCEYDDKDLCKFFTSWKAQDYYTLTSTSEVEGQKSTMTLKSEGDGKSHLKLGGEFAYEVITIGNATYTKGGDGTWWKQTTQNDTATQYEDEAKVDFEEPTTGETADKTTYKKVGKEKCGNLNCFKYEVVDPSDTENTTYLWFDDKDYQLRRTQTVSKDGKTSYDATFSYEKVSIKEPSPVKELGPNQYLMPGQSEPVTLPSTGDGMSPEELQQLMEQYQ